MMELCCFVVYRLKVDVKDFQRIWICLLGFCVIFP